MYVPFYRNTESEQGHPFLCTNDNIDNSSEHISSTHQICLQDTFITVTLIHVEAVNHLMKMCLGQE